MNNSLKQRVLNDLLKFKDSIEAITGFYDHIEIKRLSGYKKISKNGNIHAVVDMIIYDHATLNKIYYSITSKALG